jgi:hypothetical protein
LNLFGRNASSLYRRNGIPGARFMEHALEILVVIFLVIAIAGFVVAHALCISGGPREKREIRSDHSKRRPF